MVHRLASRRGRQRVIGGALCYPIFMRSSDDRAHPRARRRICRGGLCRLATKAALAVFVVAGCHRPKSYETTAEIVRVSVPSRDESAAPLVTDVELVYVACPGTQLELVRGDQAFSECVARYPVGSRVSVSLEHHWVDDGHYAWTVHKVGDCPRRVDPDDEGSVALSRDCQDWRVSGVKVGFQCALHAEKELVEACPWFRRR